MQDSWSILDKVTLNAGVRYDARVSLRRRTADLAIALPNQWSSAPGRGLRLHPAGPLEGVRQLRPLLRAPCRWTSRTESLTAAPAWGRAAGSHGRDLAEASGGRSATRIRTPGSLGVRRPLVSYVLSSPVEPAPTPRWVHATGHPARSTRTSSRQSSDEIVARRRVRGLPATRASALAYTHGLHGPGHRGHVATTRRRPTSSGNPGEGIAAAFPQGRARRTTRITVSFTKAFSDLWLAQASYTWSKLRGNYDGLFRPEDGQLEPNLNATFDSRVLLPNQEGSLSADVTHAVKLFAAKELVVTPALGVTFGAGFNATSGAPISALGNHPVYPNEVYILTRGSAGRMPWVTSLDARLGLSWRFSKDLVVTAAAEAFNLFNSQRPTAVDQYYTGEYVSPIIGAKQGSCSPGVRRGLLE